MGRRRRRGKRRKRSANQAPGTESVRSSAVGKNEESLTTE